MGRMFRIISEGVPDAAAGDLIAPAEDGVPFVEVGGPDGVVASAPAPRPAPPRVLLPPPETVPTLAIPIPDDAPEPEPEQPPAADPRVLSVAFHQFPKPGLRLAPGGVTADLVAYHFPDHPVAQEYQSVRDEMRAQFEEAGPRAVVFTAAAPVAGTTTVMLNLAASLAREASGKVLVLDANLARPGVARRLGVAESPGLAEVLRQTTPLAWAVQPTAVENLHALAAGSGTDVAADTLAADLPRLLAQLRQWFDWVLIDAGVWADAAARTVLGPACDAVYLVSRQGEIDRPEFTGLRAAVAGSGGHLRGYVTTRA